MTKYEDNRRHAMFVKQNGLCWLCGKQMVITGNPHSSLFATRDHVIPRALGGIGLNNNIRLAHAKCNSERGTMTFEEFQMYLATPKEPKKRRGRPRKSYEDLALEQISLYHAEKTLRAVTE